MNAGYFVHNRVKDIISISKRFRRFKLLENWYNHILYFLFGDLVTKKIVEKMQQQEVKFDKLILA